jgi:hypothetical protein
MRALAAHLLKLPAIELTEWEHKFLQDISRDVATEEFTLRQAEKLLQIRDDFEEVSVIGYQRFSVRILIASCKLGRLDLDEDDELWILQFPDGTSTIKRRDAGRLLRCARELNNIEEELV